MILLGKAVIGIVSDTVNGSPCGSVSYLSGANRYGERCCWQRFLFFLFVLFFFGWLGFSPFYQVCVAGLWQAKRSRASWNGSVSSGSTEYRTRQVILSPSWLSFLSSLTSLIALSFSFFFFFFQTGHQQNCCYYNKREKETYKCQTFSYFGLFPKKINYTSSG